MSEIRPVVPTELEPYLDERVLEVHRRWQSYGLAHIQRMTPEPVKTEYGNALVFEPIDHYDGRTVALALSPQHGAKQPRVGIRGKFMHETEAPNSRLIVLLENSVDDMNYHLGPEQLEAVNRGDLRPYFEHRVRLLESLGTSGELDLTGYGMGAVAAMGIASVNSSDWKVRIVNADEPPFASHRTAAKLYDDMVASGTPSERQGAANDSGLRVLDKSLSAIDLAALRRNRSSGVVRENLALLSGMAIQPFDSLVHRVAANHPDATIKIGRVAGSYLVEDGQFEHSEEQLRESRLGPVDFVTYSGPGAQRHASGINAVAVAMMYADALSRLRPA